MTYNVKNDPWNRVVDVWVRCTECDVPEYIPLDDEKVYRIVVNSYMADGGDGYYVLPENARNRYSG